MFRLDGKVALVTGGSRGIGKAISIALAAQGAEIYLSYVNGEASALETVKLIEAAGGKAHAVRFDVGDYAASEAAVAEIAKSAGRLDILVANAGISIDGLMLRLKEEDLDRTFAVNVKGALACTRSAIRPMMKAKAGRIIYLSSVVGEMGNIGQTAYAASKAALLGAAKSLAREYASRNITVNAITPGYISTDMTGSISEEARQAMLTQVPLGRAGSPEEIAGAVVFLCSDAGAYITGHTLAINGGMNM